jgi:hypothetical protein
MNQSLIIALAISDLKKADSFPDNEIQILLLMEMLQNIEPVDWHDYWKEKLLSVNKYWNSFFNE